MPDFSFDLKTEFNYYANVLLIDEVGEYATALADKLLEHDCHLNYFGKENQETFFYLSGKNNFLYLNSFSEIDSLKKIDYLFYLPTVVPQDSVKNVFKGALIKEENFFQLTQNHACKVLICCAAESWAIEGYGQLAGERRLNARLAVFDCLFGPRIKTGFLSELFRAGAGGYPAKLVSPNKQIFPLSAERLAEELISLIFSPDSKGRTYFLRGRKTSPADFANRLKTFYPGLAVEFLEGENEESDFGRERGEEKVIEEDWDETVAKTISWFSLLPPVLPLLSRVTIEPRGDEKTKEPTLPEFLVKEKPFEKKDKKDQSRQAPVSQKIFFGVAVFLLLLFVFFALPLFLAGVLGLWGMRELEGTRQAIIQGNFSLAMRKNASSQKSLGFSQQLLLTTSPFYALVGLENRVEAVNNVFRFSQSINETLYFALLASQEFFAWTNDFLEGRGTNQSEALGAIKANLASAYERASLAQSSLPAVEPGFKYLRQTAQYEKLKEYLPESREVLVKGQSLLSVLPKILGFAGRQTYLVLFQNNAELRPTGGFIGSFAIVNLENGKLVDFETFDVYQADGQLKGHVEPPAKLKEYLGEANWFLRDANWDPDFAISAQRAEWFLDKEMQIATDGVIAVTLEAARKAVASLGEVEVLDYQEKINSDNLFQKAEYYSELGSFPGSSQKKDFLASLFQSLFERVKNAESKELMGVGGGLFASLEEKEILFYFDDPVVQKVVASLNWSGSIREYQPKVGLIAAFPDYLFINEANVGVNKANYFLQRKIDHQINLANDGRIEEKLTITYDNQSPSNNWPAGAYKTYLRLYLPKGTKVTSILITDPKNSSFWLPFEWQYFDISEDHGKALFGFFLEVPIKTKRTIEIKYELPQKMDFSKKLNAYLLLVQKQPGAHPSDYTLNFVYPENFIPVRVIPSAIVGNQQLLVKNKLIKDLIFQIDLAH